MAIIECPWCDGPAVVDAAQDAVECTDCGIAVAIAADPVRSTELPLAA